MAADTPRPQPSRDEPALEAAAAVWLSLRDRGMTGEETAEFVRWLQEDPRHAEIFAELDATWAALDRLPEPATTTPAAVRHARPRRWLAPLAAAAAVLALGFGVTQLPRPARTVETTVGAFLKHDLPDGSVAQLNTDSALDVVFSSAERRIILRRGEAHFTVASNPERPFVVRAGPAEVRAVGTAFNVRTHSDRIEVLVTEGRVRIDQPETGDASLPARPDAPVLQAGEHAVIRFAAPADGGHTARVTVAARGPADIDRALAWQERRLVFDATPLAEVVAEFNRYNRAQLVIEDPRLATRRFSGNFRADGYDAFVRLLEENFDVRTSRTDRQIVLHPQVAGR